MKTSDLTRRQAITAGVATVAVAILPGCDDKQVDTETNTSTDTQTATNTQTATDTEDETNTATNTDETTDTNDCISTSDNIEGPFYISKAPERSNLDLYNDDGVPVTVSGKILDAACVPIADAVIEIWHADPEGAYDLTSDEMQYRGQIATNTSGEYSFQTLVPGQYLNGSQYRPAHIHIKIWVDKTQRLTTQLYFEDDPYNDIDPFIKDDLIMTCPTDKDGTKTCQFDFVLT